MEGKWAASLTDPFTSG